MFEIFSKFGAIHHIRLGDAKGTKGTAFVVYENVFCAKNAQERLNGFNVGGRYLTCLYFQPDAWANKDGKDGGAAAAPSSS